MTQSYPWSYSGESLRLVLLVSAVRIFARPWWRLIGGSPILPQAFATYLPGLITYHHLSVIRTSFCYFDLTLL